MRKSVLAIAAHPDDIEFVMAGTLLRLAQAGWELHYFNVANGCCGSATHGREEIAAIRLTEAQRAAEILGAKFYAPICNDMEVFYNQESLAQVASVVRIASPSIVLTHSPSDYMEDHQNTARLAVSAAFVRSAPNFEAMPHAPAVDHDIAVYHAQPHGNRDPLGQLVVPTHFINVTDVLNQKRAALEAHRSQDAWLQQSQGSGSYLQMMERFNAEVGQLSGQFPFAEGWRQHNHLGLSQHDNDPLASSLEEHKSLNSAGQNRRES